MSRKTRMRTWRVNDEWTNENDGRRAFALSDESLQIKRELVLLTHNAVRMSMLTGDQAGLFLGIARMMSRGYRLGTTREFIFLSDEDRSNVKRPGRVLRAKLARWGWECVPENGFDIWRHYIAEKSRITSLGTDDVMLLELLETTNNDVALFRNSKRFEHLIHLMDLNGTYARLNDAGKKAVEGARCGLKSET